MLHKFNFIAGFRSQGSLVTKLMVAALVAIIGLMSLLPPSLVAQSARYPIRLQNDSSYAIYHVYISSVERTDWGRDRLGDIILHPGYYINLRSFYPGQYDLKLVDEDGDSCVVPEVRVGNDTSWVITDSWLLGCEFHR